MKTFVFTITLIALDSCGVSTVSYHEQVVDSMVECLELKDQALVFEFTKQVSCEEIQTHE